MNKFFGLLLLIAANQVQAQERKIIELDQAIFERKSELPGDAATKIESIIKQINTIAANCKCP